MRPSAEQILQAIANSLITQYVPAMTEEKAQAELGLFALLIGVVSEEMERATARRLEENRELRTLFAESMAVVQDEGLRRRLRQAAGAEETDYRVAALDKTNCELLDLLIEFHAHVEDLEGEGARKVEEAIWKTLESWTKRREFAVTEMFTQMLLGSAVQRALEKEAAETT
jgi:hypothetical protein